jgi:putative NIF3 family GTP cyclohydrolase 1 type 2
VNDDPRDLEITRAAPATSSIPASARSLLESIDEIVGPPPGQSLNGTQAIADAPGPIARLGLALEPWPGLPAWTAQERLDGLFLHRPWGLGAAPPPGIAVVANHDGFDRRFGFGDNPELHAALHLHPLVRLAERDSYPLGTVAEGAARSAEQLRSELVAMFAGLDEERAGSPDRAISRVAFARAMTVELVQEAVARGAHAYVTGQLRRPALAAAAGAGLHLFAVGHRRSERWGLQIMATKLVQRWPGLVVRVAPSAQELEGAAGAGAGP